MSQYTNNTLPGANNPRTAQKSSSSLTNDGDDSPSMSKRFQRLKSFSYVAGTLSRLKKEKLKKRKLKHSIELTEILLATHSNFYQDFKGVSMIQASRNGLLDVVRGYLEAGDPEKLINDVDEEGYTALHYAARYNQVEVMRLLVKYGADINVKQGQDEVRPLHLACRYNSESAAFFLLEQRATVNIKDAKGRTPLHYATRKGHGMIIKMLISVSNCRVNEQDNDKTTPLIMAALQGSDSICETLISRGAEVELRDINFMTALMWAAAEGHTQVCKVLLKAAQRHGADSQTKYIRASDKEGNTALHLAVQNGSLEVVNLLLCHGANVNSVKLNLATPLHLAATAGFIDIVKVLVYNGADVDARDVEEMAPVHRAALYNKVEVLEFLAIKGADLNAKDKKNMSPLHCACWKGQNEAVEFLLKHGAQIAEIDITLKSALHWAVQYGNFSVVKSLFKHKDSYNLVSCTDKNDQTVLHYAAYTGDVQTLVILLEAGARPDAKDQEERSPLHIAAQNDRVSCIEALIQASNHETNDDDLDGRTPLLLACLSGHHQAVQVLLSLGSDVSRRDDEHCTALMLAASLGHTLVMKILLDNHASVNDVDKMRNTALHYACSGGHMDAVQLLLDKKADVTLKNTYFNAPIDLAIDNLHQDVVTVMLRNKSTCQQCISVRDRGGHTPMDKLIIRLPETVLIILDHCVERTSRDDEEKNLTLTFDYQYLDPGPDDPSSSKNRYLALNTMVNHGRDLLLSHPLCQNLLFQKWVGFGKNMFILNLLTYVGYLTCLTALVATTYNIESSQSCIGSSNSSNESGGTREPGETGSSYSTPSVVSNLSELHEGRSNNTVENIVPQSRYLLVVFLYLFVVVFSLRDLIKIISQKWRYFLNIYNTIVWMLMVTTVIFTMPRDWMSCAFKWRAGWIAMFLAWINFIMYLRRIDFLGIYVIMFVSVLSSLIKLILVFFMFCAAFVGSFYIVDPDFASKGLWALLINVIIMTLGEIEKKDGKGSHALGLDADILVLIFLFLMPIALMNLMIGVAVGDIEKIQKNAYLKRIGLQVDLMYNIENNMPKFLQKKVHVRKATIKPNEVPNSKCSRLWCFGKQRKVQFIEAEKKDQTTSRLESLVEKTNLQHQSMKAVMLSLQQQGAVLQQIAQKLDININSHTMPTIVAPGPSYFWSGGGGGGGGGGDGFGGVPGFQSAWSGSASQLPGPSAPTGYSSGHQRLITTSSVPPPLDFHQPLAVTASALPIPESVSVYANVNLDGVDRWRKRSIRPAKTAPFGGSGRPLSFV